MAFNKEVFKTRALSAFIFMAVMLAGLFTNFATYFLLILLIHCGAWWEYLKLVDKIENKKSTVFNRISIIILGVIAFVYFSNNLIFFQNFNYGNNIIIFLFVINFLVLLVSFYYDKEILFSKKYKQFFGFIYITLSCILLLQLSNMLFLKNQTNLNWLPNGIILPCFIIGCMWVNDTIAYLVGSFIGKTSLSKISPKKTWEGTIGGVILCSIIMGLIMFYYCNATLQFSIIIWFLIAAIAAIIGTVGDLFESKIKRLANVKDSGNILPGHGGFLDRFDSLLFATPFIWFILKFIL